MFFFMSKVLWSVFNPLTAALFVLAAGYLLVLTGRRRGRVLIAASLILIYTLGLRPSSEYLYGKLEGAVERGVLPGKVDGIIVLAGMVDMGASREGLVELTEQSDRIINAVMLARLHPEARLVITGGSGSLEQSMALREADYLKRLALSLGIEPERLVVERNSRNTHEHAVELSKMVPDIDKGSWVLITSAFHMPRSYGCFRKEGISVIPYPVDYKTGRAGIAFSALTLIPGFGNMARFNAAFHEWAGLFVYRFAGYTETVLPEIV